MELMGDKTVIGILMDEWSSSNSNGAIDGRKYFEAEDGRAYFAYPEEISENMETTNPHKGIEVDGANGIMEQLQVGQEDSLKSGKKGVVKFVGTIHFKIGDRVKLASGKEGTVKFIGRTAFAAGEIVGIELDRLYAGGHEGTVQAQKGRGYFIRRQAISSVTIPLVRPDHQRNKSLRSKLNPLKIRRWTYWCC